MTYQEVQKELVASLRELGIWYEEDERIAAAWLRNNLKFVATPGVDITSTIKLLDRLVLLRTQGLEPRAIRGRYVTSED